MFLFFRSFLALSLMFIFFSCGDSDDSSSGGGSSDSQTEVTADNRCGSGSGLIYDEEEAVKEEEAASNEEREVDESKFCRNPKTGYFVNDFGEEEDCTPIENITDEEGNDGDFLSNIGPLAEDSCPFKCQAGYVKDASGRACNIPPLGKYADANGVTRDCSKIEDGDATEDDGQGNQIPVYADFQDSEDPVDHPDKCPFACNSGTRPDPMVVDGEEIHPRICNGEYAGWYTKIVEGTKKRTECTPIKYQSRWVALTTDADNDGNPDLPTTDTCGFECKAGYLKVSRTCVSPTKGKYVQADGTTEADCATIIDSDGSGFDDFTIAFVDTDGDGAEDAHFPVANDKSCPFDCNGGYVKTDTDSERSCEGPEEGYYGDADGAPQKCVAIPSSQTLGGAVPASSSDPLFTAKTCPFTCESGYVKNETKRSCTLPPPGKYADASGVETACDSVGDNGVSLPNSGPISDKAACPYICNRGYIKGAGGARGCSIPRDGYYADANGDEQQCTSGTKIPHIHELGSNAQLAFEVIDSDSCPFICDAGYKPNFRNRECEELGDGSFVDARGQVGDCGSHPANAIGWTTAQAPTVQSADKCTFECADKRHPATDANTGSGGSCAIPVGHVVAPDGTQGASPAQAAGGINSPNLATPCENGLVPNDAKTVCEAPSQGYFALLTPVTGNTGSGAWTSNTGYVETKCNPSANFDDDNPSDDDAKKGAPATSVAWVANQSNGWTSDAASRAGNVDTAAECKFTCANHREVVDAGSTGRCDVAPGFVVTGGPATDGAATACTSGQVANSDQTACVSLTKGYYAHRTTTGSRVGHVKTACNTADANTDGVPDFPASSTDWVADQSNGWTGNAALSSNVDTAEECKFACGTHRVPDLNVNSGLGKDGSCDVAPGFVVTASSGPAGNGAATACSGGKVANSGQTACKDPDQGYFADSTTTNGRIGYVQTTCNTADANTDGVPDFPASSTGWVANQSTGWSGTDSANVDTAGECKFACTNNRVMDGAGSAGSCDVAPGFVVTALRGPAGNGAATVCSGGKVANSGQTACKDPDQGYFAASTTTNGRTGYVQTTCNTADANTDGVPDFPASSTGWVANQSAGWTGSDSANVDTAAECKFTCGANRRPATGASTGSGGNCNVPPGYVVTGGPTTDGDASLCTSGQVADSRQETCGNPSQGYWSDNGVEKQCTGSAPASSTGWMNVQPSRVTSATTCEFTCANGRTISTQKGSTGTCDLNPGFVARDPDGAGVGSLTAVNGAVLCGVVTNVNPNVHQVPNDGQTACESPSQGYWSDNGVEKQCTGSAPASSTGWMNVQPSRVTSATTCEFTCANGRTASAQKGSTGTCGLNPGFVAGDPDNVVGPLTANNGAIRCGVNSGIRQVPNSHQTACISPAQGYWSNNGVQTPCNPAQSNPSPASSLGWISTQLAAVNVAGKCEFTCDTGRTATSQKGPTGGCHLNPGYIAADVSNDIHRTKANGAQQCTGGKVPETTMDSTEPDACINPKAGYYSDNGVESPCDLGTYASGSTARTSCTPCSNQKISPKGSDSASDCTQSQPGYYSLNNVETPCPAGTYGVGLAERTACTSCSSTGEVSPMGSDSENDCVNPKAGHYSNNGAETPCDPGTYASGSTARTSCTSTCSSGQVSPAGSTQASDCINPKIGHYSDSGIETPCDPGTYASDSTTARTSCTSTCSSGQVSPAGASACSNPLAGHYSDNGVEIPCAPGTYASGSTARTSCTSTCSSGQVSAAGSTQVSDCVNPKTGHYSDSGAETPCPPGTGAHGSASRTSCTPCQAGTYYPNTGFTAGSLCWGCASGQVSDAGASKCRPPKTGYFSNKHIETSCENLPANATAWRDVQPASVDSKFKCKVKTCSTGATLINNDQNCSIN